MLEELSDDTLETELELLESLELDELCSVTIIFLASCGRLGPFSSYGIRYPVITASTTCVGYVEATSTVNMNCVSVNAPEKGLSYN